MAEKMTGMLVENTMVVGTGAKRGQGRMPRIGLFGAVAAILAVLLIGGAAVHTRSTSHAVAPAIAHTTTSAEIRFLEENTITLPNAVASDSRPDVITSERQRFLEWNTILPDGVAVDTRPVVIPSSQQRFLEENTTTLPSVGAANSPAVVTSGQQRFWEVNTDLGMGESSAIPAYPYGEAITPVRGPR